MKKTFALACLCVLMSVSGTSVLASGNAEEGRQLAYTCTGCHGIPGYINAYPTYHVPKIGGQNYEYIVSALKAYRSGERTHPTMNAQATTLTDQQIDDIASYFVTFKNNKETSE